MIDWKELLLDFKERIRNMSDQEIESSLREAEFLSAPGQLYRFDYILEGGARGWGYVCAVDTWDAINTVGDMFDHFIPTINVIPVITDEWRHNKLNLYISPQCKKFLDW